MSKLLPLIALLALIAAPAHGQMIKASDFEVRAGGEAAYLPDYLGSDESELTFVPDVEVVYQKHAYLSSQYGAGIYLFNEGNTRLGLGVGPDFGRDEGSNSHLRGLGDVDFGWDLNAFIDANFDPFLVGFAVSHEFANGSGGTLVNGYVGYREGLTERLTGTLKLSSTWTDGDRNMSYYGVTAAQAASSGLPAFVADDGVRDVTLSTGLVYAYNKNIDFTGTARWTRLMGDTADSPVTQDKDQVVLLLGATYNFPAKRWQPPK